MAKGFSALQSQLERAAGRDRPASASSSRPEKSDAADPHSKMRGREGKTHIGAYLHPDFKRSLMLVRAQTGQDVQTLIARALNDLFRTYNVPVIDHQ